MDALNQEFDCNFKIASTIITGGNWVQAWHDLVSDNQLIPVDEREIKEITSEIIDLVKSGSPNKANILLSKWLSAVMPLQADKRLVLVVHFIFLLNQILESLHLEVDYRNFYRIISGDVNKNQKEMLELIIRQQLVSTIEAVLLGSERKINFRERIDNILQEKQLNLVTLNDIAEELGVSTQYLCKTYKEETGITVHKYLTSKRLKYAKNLLKYSKLSIKEIAQECGFQDTIYFTKLFKRYNEITPSEYRSR